MSGDGIDGVAGLESAPTSPASSKAEPKASPKAKRAAKPKIDLDDEIRRANELASVSRKMLMAAKASSKNNKKAKQRLIKKAGKLSPEDLERIAVLKRCGLFVDNTDDDVDEGDGDNTKLGTKKFNAKTPSLEESKRAKLTKTLQSLTDANPILGEFGVAPLGVSSSVPSSIASGSKDFLQKKTVVVLDKRARLPLSPSMDNIETDSQVGQEDDEI